MRAVSILLLAGVACAQAPGPQAGTAAGRGGGAGAANRPAISSSVRLEDWALFRSAASSILGWKVGVPAGAYRQLTLSEAAAKADALGVAFVAGSSTQKLSREIPKNLDPRLTANELEAFRDRMRALNMRMPAYFAASMGSDAADVRKLFEFAKALGVETIVASPDPASLAMVDKLAEEFSVNVALLNRSRKETPEIGRAHV